MKKNRRKSKKHKTRTPLPAATRTLSPRAWLAVVAVAAISATAAGYWTLGTGNTTQSGSPQAEVAITPSAETAVPAPMLREAIDRAANYLNLQLMPSGQFIYRTNLNADVRLKPRYNILRHAGTMYALGIQAQRSGDPASAATIQQACGFLKKQIEPVPGIEGVFAVWSYPHVCGRQIPPQAKLGGAGLGLVALLECERLAPSTTAEGILQGLGAFLLAMQRPDGSFYSKYVPSRGGYDSWVSLYYPGEAALGLVMLHEHDGKQEWLDAATAAMRYLAESRHGDQSVPHDHWALLATARLLQVDAVRSDTATRKLLIGHTKQICEAILASQLSETDSRLVHGSFGKDGRTTPCATRMEGLLAALEILPPAESVLRDRIRLACDRGVWFLIEAQIDSGPFSGGLPRSVYGNPRFADVSSASRDARSTEIRIDYVQHALSAFIQYEGLLHGSDNSRSRVSSTGVYERPSLRPAATRQSTLTDVSDKQRTTDRSRQQSTGGQPVDMGFGRGLSRIQAQRNPTGGVDGPQYSSPVRFPPILEAGHVL